MINIHYIIDIRSIILSCQFINFYSKVDDKFNIFRIKIICLILRILFYILLIKSTLKKYTQTTYYIFFSSKQNLK